MGLVKSIEKLSAHKDINLNEEIYTHIETWKDLYKGYHEPWHKIAYTTISGAKTRKMDTLGIAKTVAAEMASLVYNEKCEFSFSDDALYDNVKSVLDDNNFNRKFQDYLEYSFAHGGMVIKPYIKNDKITLSFVTADCFIPIAWHNDTITEAVFPFEFQKGDKKYTHLEWHVWESGVYVVRNEVYESSNGEDLGNKVSLSNHYPDLDEEVRINGLAKPLFVYFKPNSANNIDTRSPLGISIFANALDTMKAIDTAFDSLHREFRLGRKRIIVPAHMVKTVVDTDNGTMQRYFDSSDETYEAFNSGEMDDNSIKDISIELRVDEHVAAINALLNLFAMQTGFSSGAFTFDGTSMKTATEVVSEQSKTFKTKQSHEIIIESGLKDLVGAIVAIAELYGIFTAPNDYEVTIAFDDSIAEDKAAEITREIQMISSGIQSRKRAIKNIQGVTEEEALDILKEIYQEQREESPDREQLEQESILFGGSE